jgi:hypothetical protein
MSDRGLAGSLLVAMTVAGANVSAGEFVEIESGTRAEPVRLIGYMARPPGAGPFSAVVLLHGCGGFHSSMISWADRLAYFGYAARLPRRQRPRVESLRILFDRTRRGFSALSPAARWYCRDQASITHSNRRRRAMVVVVMCRRWR